MVHLNMLLPYMLDQETMEDVSSGSHKNLKQVWEYGKISDYQLKQVWLSRVPARWKQTFERSALSESSPLSELIDYFNQLESQERNSRLIGGVRMQATMRGGGRGISRGRGYGRYAGPPVYSRNYNTTAAPPAGYSQPAWQMN